MNRASRTSRIMSEVSIILFSNSGYFPLCFRILLDSVARLLCFDEKLYLGLMWRIMGESL